MVFKQTAVDRAFVIQVQPALDNRGWFARTSCSREFQQQGLVGEFAQCSLSYNLHRGTLRGLHFQAAPHEETKLVRCIRGAIYDVIVDLRKDSQTFLTWVAFELTADNHLALYIPEGVAHGFITLQDDTEVFYQITGFYEPAAARGIRWNDPAFAIRWPCKPTVISDRDMSHPDYCADPDLS
jgi:dTDP-4-dehydrorhamnose 3,5-epimerase